MTMYNIHEAKRRFSELLRRVMNGEEIIIARASEPVAVLKPIEAPPAKRLPGNDMGKVVIRPIFDEPLPEFEL